MGFEITMDIELKKNIENWLITNKFSTHKYIKHETSQGLVDMLVKYDEQLKEKLKEQLKEELAEMKYCLEAYHKGTRNLLDEKPFREYSHISEQTEQLLDNDHNEG
jgi:hypothetical protein